MKDLGEKQEANQLCKIVQVVQKLLLNFNSNRSNQTLMKYCNKLKQNITPFSFAGDWQRYALV